MNIQILMLISNFTTILTLIILIGVSWKLTMKKELKEVKERLIATEKKLQDFIEEIETKE